MNAYDRTFTVIELGQPVSATAIRLPSDDTVEVIDITTRSVLRVKARAVSMYRHTLRWQGKSYNILNIH
ncbi:MAG TPA: hypothetical protein VGE12_14850 [Noviherbaspirillum sp.]